MENKLSTFRGSRTQREMAEHYGVSQQLWSLWEKGERTPPAATMLRLQQDSGIPMEQLFYTQFNNKR